jgi:type I restriction-modification system DNA methylase subunit
MATALAQKGKVLQLKKKLLQKHTLEAVFSMPDELFFNSKVGVISCVMVFTAKRPHPAGKNTHFAYCKDDGFVKRKNKGRIDLFDKFTRIRDDWVTAYFNKDEIKGFTVNKVVAAEDEWCAEAYMDTDYTTLTNDDFIKEIRKYTASQITKGIL